MVRSACFALFVGMVGTGCAAAGDAEQESSTSVSQSIFGAAEPLSQEAILNQLDVLKQDLGLDCEVARNHEDARRNQIKGEVLKGGMNAEAHAPDEKLIALRQFRERSERALEALREATETLSNAIQKGNARDVRRQLNSAHAIAETIRKARAESGNLNQWL